MTVVSGNISFVPIFEGVPWRGGVKQQWGIYIGFWRYWAAYCNILVEKGYYIFRGGPTYESGGPLVVALRHCHCQDILLMDYSNQQKNCENSD